MGAYYWVITFEEHDGSAGSIHCGESRVHPPIPADCTPALAHIMSCCWDANSDVQPGFLLVVKMLEQACEEIMTTVQHARFWDVDVWQCLTWVIEKSTERLEGNGVVDLYIAMFHTRNNGEFPSCYLIHSNPHWGMDFAGKSWDCWYILLILINEYERENAFNFSVSLQRAQLGSYMSLSP